MPGNPNAQKVDEPDPRNSLRHVLATDPTPETRRLQDAPSVGRSKPSSVQNDQDSIQEDASSNHGSSKMQTDGPAYTATTTGTRRNANGSVSSVYSGNKIRHLKKEDGVPLWRKDIQYDFLRAVFEDDKPVFHKASDGTAGHSFADIYLDAMAKSSKCSKILKDKLLSERAAAVNMAMVCLLVNVGRMNTTLNFFPEMRAQLRTYHSIPSLQAQQDPNSYKQLQDAPRLKSILKGATEDTEQPSTIEDIKAASIPRTNPVNLIFVLAQYAPKISEIHFQAPRDFFDLVMRSALSSRSRAQGFLWLMWWYLESDFTREAALNNPFGPGQPGTDGDLTEGLPIKLPPFEHLSEDQAALENVDTEEEKIFGDLKQKERLAIISSDMAPVAAGPKRTTKKDDGTGSPAPDTHSPLHAVRNGIRSKASNSKAVASHDYYSDTDRTRSASPPDMQAQLGPSKTNLGMRINTLLNDESSSVPPVAILPKGGSRTSLSRSRAGAGGARLRSKLDQPKQTQTPDASSPNAGPITSSGPHGFYLPLNGSDPTQKRSRPLTSHQIAVERYRKERVDFILDCRLRANYARQKQLRRKESAVIRAWRRCAALPEGYDTEDDEDQRLPGGFATVGLSTEQEDYGEEVHSIGQALRRAARRLERWDGDPAEVEASLGTSKRSRRRWDEARDERPWYSRRRGREVRDERAEDGAEDEQEIDVPPAGGIDMGVQDEELDDLEREMLEEVDADDTDDAAEEDQDQVMGNA